MVRAVLEKHLLRAESEVVYERILRRGGSRLPVVREVRLVDNELRGLVTHLDLQAVDRSNTIVAEDGCPWG